MNPVIFIFLFLSFFASALQAQVIIGNGGEGVRIGEQIVLRDLYEEGSHENPEMGQKVDNDFLVRFYELKLDLFFATESELFLQKITQIEGVYPGVGRAILEAFAYFKFKFVSQPLPLLPNDSNSVSNDQRVQLALRRYSDIYIDYKSWLKMAVPQRVALMVHEALYSYLEVECKDSVCSQYSIQVRPLIGQLFLKKTTKDIGQLLKRIGFDSVMAQCKIPYLINGQFSIFEKDTVQGPLYEKKLNLNKEDDFQNTFAFISDKIDSFAQMGMSVTTVSDFFRPIVLIRSNTYYSDYGTQTALVFESSSSVYKKQYSFTNKTDFYITFMEEVKKWIHINRFNNILDPLLYCKRPFVSMGSR
ncbi:MAG: hypothetical protein ACOYOK_07505 [Pseudobdellovibrionaceae bacterium]